MRVDAQVEVRAGNDGTVGVVCRYSQANGWYEFNIYADQTYMLMYGQWLAPGIARYMPLHRIEFRENKNWDESDWVGMSRRYADAIYQRCANANI